MTNQDRENIISGLTEALEDRDLTNDEVSIIYQCLCLMVNRRSPEQVRKMEREKGLRVAK